MLRECVAWWRGAEHSQEWCATEAGVRKGKERVFSTSQPANIPTCFQPILASPPYLLFWKAENDSQPATASERQTKEETRAVTHATVSARAAKRVFNFNAGPGALPLPVLERIREELLDWRGSGMSVMDAIHHGSHEPLSPRKAR